MDFSLNHVHVTLSRKLISKFTLSSTLYRFSNKQHEKKSESSKNFNTFPLEKFIVIVRNLYFSLTHVEHLRQLALLRRLSTMLILRRLFCVSHKPLQQDYCQYLQEQSCGTTYYNYCNLPLQSLKNLFISSAKQQNDEQLDTQQQRCPSNKGGHTIKLLAENWIPKYLSPQLNSKFVGKKFLNT